MRTKGLFYFAHPYTCKDSEGRYVPTAEEANFRLCCQRSGELLLRGYNVYSPIAHTHPIHVSTVPFLQNHEHQLWYQLDQEVIDRTAWDGIILAPDWEHSPGCGAERLEFVKKGLPVLFYDVIIQKEEPIYE